MISHDTVRCVLRIDSGTRLHCYFMNIRSERKTYLVPFTTGDPS